MERSIKRHVHAYIAAVVATTALLAIVAPAGADPVRPPDRHPVTIHCDQLGDRNVIAEGNGEWTHSALALHALDSNLMLLMYKYRYAVTPVGGATFVVEGEKPAPQSGRLDVCRWTETFPQGTISSTVGVSYTFN